jgi:NhaA family Na+:H+ antiporter
VVPALIYVVLNRGSEATNGWAIPMATDIAFALGVMALLGDRVPVSLKIFVTALAIVDDIVGVLVIAVFYTSQISYRSLFAGLVGVGVSFLANRMGVRRPLVYAMIGVFVWIATLKSGIHATIAGILLAFTIPTETHVEIPAFLERARGLLDRIASAYGKGVVGSHQEEGAAYELERQSEQLQTPLYRIEHTLQPWVAFVVMPLFALSNAGVHVLGNIQNALFSSVGLGVGLGLFLGKPVGITLFAWLAAKTGMAAKPAEARWSQLFGASCLCGIGFTMSLFIATLAFGDRPLLDTSKIGTLAASLAAGVVGSLVVIRTARGRTSGT